MNNTNNNSNIPKKLTARQLYLNSNYAKNNTSENEINQEQLNQEEELNEQRSERMERMDDNFEKKMENNTQFVNNQEDKEELLNEGFAGKIHIAPTQIHHTREEYYTPKKYEPTDKNYDPMIKSTIDTFNSVKTKLAEKMGLRKPVNMLNSASYGIKTGIFNAKQGLSEAKNAISAGTHFAKMKVTDNNLFQKLFNFSQTIIAQKIYCIIGVLLLGALFNLAKNSGNTTRSNFLTYCVWTWIYLLIALIVLNYVFKLVFQ